MDDADVIYERRFKLHEKTGVLMTFRVLKSRRLPESYEPGDEPCHVLLRGDIEAPRERRRGVWQYADTNRSDKIFFTCPWCGAIGSSYKHQGGQTVDSLVCGSVVLSEDPYGGGCKKHGCVRHLSLHYREETDREKGYL